MRVVFGFISSLFLIDQFFLGPIETFEVLANFSTWCNAATLLTMGFQFKSAAYQNRAKVDTTGTAFPYQVYYKKEALMSLMAANSMNLILAFAYFVFKLPNTSEDFSTTALKDSYGSGDDARNYF
mmetsp:Transcript_17848/g.30286  ORF Transcript_17848/g.30286 Transcript_17848/m.30286 type:complete len:125 (+) Transcript_17848:235-609(+)